MTTTGSSKTSDTGSSSSLIVQDVIRGLYEGRFVPGQRLVEPDLVRQYEVSRSTVREALKQLSADGIVVSHPYRGASIRKLTRTEAANLFAIMEVILGLAARQAAQKIETPGAREKLTEHLEAIATHEDTNDRFEFLRRRNRYFRALTQIAENPELGRLLPRFQAHLVRNRLTLTPEQRVEGYRKITDAVLSGDPRRAERVARGYIAMTAARALPLFPE
ncbi:GntR family transcriptional regulator [Pseudodonghicola flavimaris]|uniref:GntR family transcriptional regulator n=1 Tax=Pseudodonghicola flavimaris TaxID=3050036 RepID=A0ABT7EUM0_9RHOB|nr:GntR family transcriptional regulator [Pseudodonghicola flavimaris]MDK3016044.1 GntR family transcriptional regulator [Pseudodonghicola flavimaris]